MFVLTSMIVTVAPGIGRPPASVTLPRRVPVTACAHALEAEGPVTSDRTANARPTTTCGRYIDGIISNLPSERLRRTSDCALRTAHFGPRTSDFALHVVIAASTPRM